MTRKRRRLLLSLLLSGTIILAVWSASRNRADNTANQWIRTSNEALQAGAVAALKFQEKSREVGQLLNETSFREERSKLTKLAKEAALLAEYSEQGFRMAADAAQKAIDHTHDDASRAVWTLKRDSLLQRAEGAAAGREGYTLVADESIVDLPTLFARMEPSAQRAEKAKAEAERLNAEAQLR